ncbi:hypothetical protein [Nocardioides sp.]|uniref:hypothetical protein n=1 Tax=Nocardioides sp. TaxID=35761 RepID=UPI0035134A16
MGWESELFALFDDLEAQASSLSATERLAEHVDRSRAEYQTVSLAGRLMASVGSEVSVRLNGVPGAVGGVLERVADGWLLVAAGDVDWIVSTAAVSTVQGASVRAVPEAAWSPLTRLGLGSALRRIAEAGEECVVHLIGGDRLEGFLRRVGQDFCELVEGEDRRVQLVAFSALAAVRSHG